jgi:hypothetical protein
LRNGTKPFELACGTMRGSARRRVAVLMHTSAFLPCAGCQSCSRQSKCTWAFGSTGYHMMPAGGSSRETVAPAKCAQTMCQPLSPGRSGIVSAFGPAGGLPTPGNEG